MYKYIDWSAYQDALYHHGILGQKWGVRRYQNPDGSLTEEGRKRYGYGSKNFKKADEYQVKVVTHYSKTQLPRMNALSKSKLNDKEMKIVNYIKSNSKNSNSSEEMRNLVSSEIALYESLLNRNGYQIKKGTIGDISGKYIEYKKTGNEIPYESKNEKLNDESHINMRFTTNYAINQLTRMSMTNMKNFPEKESKQYMSLMKEVDSMLKDFKKMSNDPKLNDDDQYFAFVDWLSKLDEERSVYESLCRKEKLI